MNNTNTAEFLQTHIDFHNVTKCMLHMCRYVVMNRIIICPHQCGGQRMAGDCQVSSEASISYCFFSSSVLGVQTGVPVPSFYMTADDPILVFMTACQTYYPFFYPESKVFLYMVYHNCAKTSKMVFFGEFLSHLLLVLMQ